MPTISEVSGFDDYDFESDERWKNLERTFDIPAGVDANAAILKKKKKYYKNYINSNYDISEPSPSPSTQQSNTTSESNSTASASASASSNNSSSSSTSSSQPNYSRNYSDFESFRQHSNENFQGKSFPFVNRLSPSLVASLTLSVSYFHRLLHLLILLSAFLYLIPIQGAEEQFWSFYRVLKFSMAANVVHLLRKFGFPQWNIDYGRALLFDEKSHHIGLAFILLQSTPMALLIIPFALRSVLFLSRALLAILPPMFPSFYSRFLASPLSTITAAESVRQQAEFCALIEVLTMFIFFFQLFTPARQILLLFLYGHFLRVRYMVSAELRGAFTKTNLMIQGVLQKQWMPPIVRNVYEKAVGFLYSFVDPQLMQQQAQQPNRCNVM